MGMRCKSFKAIPVTSYGTAAIPNGASHHARWLNTINRGPPGGRFSFPSTSQRVSRLINTVTIRLEACLICYASTVGAPKIAPLLSPFASTTKENAASTCSVPQDTTDQ